MLGLETTATSGDVSIVSVVCLVMMGGCAFGIALGYPWKWMVAASVLYLFAVGYPGSATLLLAAAVTARSYAPHLVRWLESLDIGRVEPVRSETRFRKAKAGRASSGRGTHHGSHRRKRGEQHWTFEDFVAGDANRTTSPQKSNGPTPEKVLGLGTEFTMKDLDAARRKMAKKFHPDLHRCASAKTQNQMAEKMRRINAAYESLKSQVA